MSQLEKIEKSLDVYGTTIQKQLQIKQQLLAQQQQQQQIHPQQLLPKDTRNLVSILPDKRIVSHSTPQISRQILPQTQKNQNHVTVIDLASESINHNNNNNKQKPIHQPTQIFTIDEEPKNKAPINLINLEQPTIVRDYNQPKHQPHQPFVKENFECKHICYYTFYKFDEILILNPFFFSQ